MAEIFELCKNFGGILEEAIEERRQIESECAKLRKWKMRTIDEVIRAIDQHKDEDLRDIKAIIERTDG